MKRYVPRSVIELTDLVQKQRDKEFDSIVDDFMRDIVPTDRRGEAGLQDFKPNEVDLEQFV